MSFNPGQKTSAKGKLLDCYRQRRREFIKSGVIAESSKRGSSSTSRVGSPRPSSGCSVQDAIDQLNEFTEDVDEKLLWLKNCCDPWVTVELNWDITAKKRLTDLTSSEITVEDYLRELKPLNQPGGVFLLLKDFKNLYQETDDKLYQNWPIVRPKIIKEVKKRSFNVDSGLKDITTHIDDDDDEVLDLIGFTALPFLMTTSIVKKTNSKKRWRPSKHEALQGFICHVKAAAEIEETITRRKSKLEELGLTLQPFIIVYWVDYKAKLKKKVATVKASQNRTGGSSDAIYLSDVEEKFASILGVGFITGSPAIVDPSSAPTTLASGSVKLETPDSSAEEIKPDTSQHRNIRLNPPAPRTIPPRHSTCRPVRRPRARHMTEETARRSLVEFAKASLDESRRNGIALENILYQVTRIADKIERFVEGPKK